MSQDLSGVDLKLRDDSLLVLESPDPLISAGAETHEHLTSTTLVDLPQGIDGAKSISRQRSQSVLATITTIIKMEDPSKMTVQSPPVKARSNASQGSVKMTRQADSKVSNMARAQLNSARIEQGSQTLDVFEDASDASSDEQVDNRTTSAGSLDGSSNSD